MTATEQMTKASMVGWSGDPFYMPLQYNDEQRREYLNMVDNIAQHWLRVFDQNTEFYSAVYWDLFTRIWKSDRPVRRTDALKFMTSVKSAATAGKYINEAIRQRLLHEYPNPQDARSKLLEMSADLRARLETYFDKAVSEVRKANQSITQEEVSDTWSARFATRKALRS